MPESVTSTSEFIGVCQRLAAYYIALVQKETARGISGYARLDKDRMHYLNLMKNCLQLGLLEDVYALARAIDIYLDRGGYGTERIDALEMNLKAARLSGDCKDEGWCLNSLGYICERRGEVEKALMYYKQNLTIRSELKRNAGKRANLHMSAEEARVTWNIGYIYLEQADFINAETYMEKAVNLMKAIEHPELGFYWQRLEQVRAARRAAQGKGGEE